MFFAPVALVTASPPSGWVFFRCYWLSIIYIVLLLTWLACCRDNHAHNGSAVLPLLNPPLEWICEETANVSSPVKRTLTTCILALQISQSISNGSHLGHILSIEPYTSLLDILLCYWACLSNCTCYPHHHHLVGVEAQLIQEWCFGDIAPAVWLGTHCAFILYIYSFRSSLYTCRSTCLIIIHRSAFCDQAS